MASTRVQSRDKSEGLEKSRSAQLVHIDKETLSQNLNSAREELKGQPAGISDSMEQKTAYTKGQDSSLNTTNINENSGISGNLCKKPSSAILRTPAEVIDDKDRLS